MEGNLCWNCARMCECRRILLPTHPCKRCECAEFVELPPEPRFTHSEMALALGCSKRKIDMIIGQKHGADLLAEMLERIGIIVSYEQINKRIIFYKEKEELTNVK